MVILSELGKEPIEVRGRGKSRFSRLTTMVYESDYASYYIAVGLGRDPFPVPLITRLKKAV